MSLGSPTIAHSRLVSIFEEPPSGVTVGECDAPATGGAGRSWVAVALSGVEDALDAVENTSNGGEQEIFGDGLGEKPTLV